MLNDLRNIYQYAYVNNEEPNLPYTPYDTNSNAQWKSTEQITSAGVLIPNINIPIFKVVEKVDSKNNVVSVCLNVKYILFDSYTNTQLSSTPWMPIPRIKEFVL